MPETLAGVLIFAFLFLTPVVAIVLICVRRLVAKAAGLLILVGWVTVIAISISQLEACE
ncbi:MAG: hypothetical protein IIC86_08925 [Chloroflexi bacterium]|nr:hypothetical protein [Chloroflexota bacterium]